MPPKSDLKHDHNSLIFLVTSALLFSIYSFTLLRPTFAKEPTTPSQLVSSDVTADCQDTAVTDASDTSHSMTSSENASSEHSNSMAPNSGETAEKGQDPGSTSSNQTAAAPLPPLANPTVIPTDQTSAQSPASAQIVPKSPTTLLTPPTGTNISVLPVPLGVPRGTVRTEIVPPPPTQGTDTLPQVLPATVDATPPETLETPQTQDVPIAPLTAHPVDTSSGDSSAEQSTATDTSSSPASEIDKATPKVAKLCPPPAEAGQSQAQTDMQQESSDEPSSTPSKGEEQEIKKAIEHTKRSLSGIHPF